MSLSAIPDFLHGQGSPRPFPRNVTLVSLEKQLVPALIEILHAK